METIFKSHFFIPLQNIFTRTSNQESDEIELKFVFAFISHQSNGCPSSSFARPRDAR